MRLAIAQAQAALEIDEVPVGAIIVRDQRVIGVETDHGDLDCEAVVNCAGMWARDLGLANDIHWAKTIAGCQ